MTVSSKLFQKIIKIGKDMKIIEFQICLINANEADLGEKIDYTLEKLSFNRCKGRIMDTSNNDYLDLRTIFLVI